MWHSQWELLPFFSSFKEKIQTCFSLYIPVSVNNPFKIQSLRRTKKGTQHVHGSPRTWGNCDNRLKYSSRQFFCDFIQEKKEKTALLKLAIVRSLWAILASFHVFLPCVQTYHTEVTCYFTVKNYQIYVKRTLHEWNCHGDHTWSLPTLALYLCNIRWLLISWVSDKSIWSSVVKKAQIVASNSCQSVKSLFKMYWALVLDCN